MKPVYSLWQLVRYMLGLGTWGFGGPVALAGAMFRDPGADAVRKRVAVSRCWRAGVLVWLVRAPPARLPGRGLNGVAVSLPFVPSYSLTVLPAPYFIYPLMHPV